MTADRTTTKPRLSVNCWSHYHRDCRALNWCKCSCHVESPEHPADFANLGDYSGSAESS